MSRKLIFFVTSNPEKLKDLLDMHKKYSGLDIQRHEQKISEPRGSEINDIVREKALEAYRHLRQPLLVDHTSLSIEAVGGLPGSSSDEFWTSISPNYSTFVRSLNSRAASMSVGLCYTDGKNFFPAVATTQGKLSDITKGSRIFGWDNVFIPVGQNKTFSEMSVKEKNMHSARTIAFESLVEIMIGRAK